MSRIDGGPKGRPESAPARPASSGAAEDPSRAAAKGAPAASRADRSPDAPGKGESFGRDTVDRRARSDGATGRPKAPQKEGLRREVTDSAPMSSPGSKPEGDGMAQPPSGDLPGLSGGRGGANEGAAAPNSEGPAATPEGLERPRVGGEQSPEDAARPTADPFRRPTPPRVGPRAEVEDVLPPGGPSFEPPSSQMSPQEALAELRRMGVEVEPLRRGAPNTEHIECPVRIDYPINGVDFRYAGRDRTSGRGGDRIRGGGLVLHRNHRELDRVVDARLALHLARTAEWARGRGITHVAMSGMHNRNRDPRYDHARGMAVDIAGFVHEDRPDHLVTVGRDWRTARSATQPQHGPRAGRGPDPGARLSPQERRQVVVPLEEERARMTDDERLMRDYWAFAHRDCVTPADGRREGFSRGSVVSPSHNAGHHDHLHVGLPLSAPNAADAPWPPSE